MWQPLKIVWVCYDELGNNKNIYHMIQRKILIEYKKVNNVFRISFTIKYLECKEILKEGKCV